ncbi:MAG: arylsulfatase B [Pirellulaceae bacterium]|jgi:arylsulfatase A-like enzyme
MNARIDHQILLRFVWLLGIVAWMLTDGSMVAAKPPNILIFLVDDLGWSDVGFHGGSIPTPHIDRLAAAGTRLEAFYVQNLCSPTRAALLTGRYPIRHGLQLSVVRPWARYGLPLEERTLADALKQVGYTTAIAGKWHLGHVSQNYLPTHRGFDHQYGHYNGAIDYLEHTRDGGFDWHRDDQVCKDEGHATELIGKEAIRLINQQPKDKPLFLYVPFNAPHTPLQAMERDLEALRGVEPRNRRIYSAMVLGVDRMIGQIMEAIKSKGWADQTLVVFSADNGGPIGAGATNGTLRAGKGTPYEGGVRAAAFATWPGVIPAGKALNEPLHVVDWYPTLVRLAGGSLDQPLPIDGKNLWPALTEQAPSPHEEILLHAAPGVAAMRCGKWKLIGKWGRDAKDPDTNSASMIPNDPVDWELYDLLDDPAEETNLAEAEPHQVEAMKKFLLKYQEAAVPPRNKPKPPNFLAPAVWGQFPASN